jgi:hypothetical protein
LRHRRYPFGTLVKDCKHRAIRRSELPSVCQRRILASAETDPLKRPKRCLFRYAVKDCKHRAVTPKQHRRHTNTTDPSDLAHALFLVTERCLFRYLVESCSLRAIPPKGHGRQLHRPCSITWAPGGEGKLPIKLCSWRGCWCTTLVGDYSSSSISTSPSIKAYE